MLKEGFSHATEDRDARALAEQRVEAEALLGSIDAALGRDGDLLSAAERAAITASMGALHRLREGSDHRRIKAGVEELNRASEAFAGRRMDRAITTALSGRRVDEISR